MQPDQKTQGLPNIKKRDRKDQFKPKWRHFHPQDTLYIKNPFKEDIIFQVADEHNRPNQYRLPTGQVCELPGGAVATLGLKEIVDRLIGESKEDAVHIWSADVRAKYEKQVIVKLKEAPRRAEQAGPGGTINLGSDNETQPDDEQKTDDEEEAFPTETASLKSPPPMEEAKHPQETANQENINQINKVSQGQKDQVIEED